MTTLGIVYEIECSNLTPEETAARLCDAVLSRL